MEKFKNFAVALLCVVIVIGIIWYGYDKKKKEKELETVESVVSQETFVAPTIDQAINDWNIEQETYELYNLCMELPEEIVKTIISRIGTTATYIEIAEEYLRNTSYYISSQIKDKIPNITGPDAGNASVTISTNVKRPKDEGVKVPVNIKDSIN